MSKSHQKIRSQYLYITLQAVAIVHTDKNAAYILHSVCMFCAGLAARNRTVNSIHIHADTKT